MSAKELDSLITSSDGKAGNVIIQSVFSVSTFLKWNTISYRQLRHLCETGFFTRDDIAVWLLEESSVEERHKPGDD